MTFEKPDLSGEHFELYKVNSDITLTVFGGLGHQVGQPMFEFRKILKPLNMNLLFFKDIKRGWYHHALTGFGATLPEKAEFVTELLETIPSNRRLFLGSSAGGFAALMFSRLVPDVSDCLLFGPQVFIDRHTRNVLSDHRWPKLIDQIQAERYLNVVDIAHKPQCRTRLIVGDNCIIDMHHALFARGYIPLDIHVLTKGGHNPAGELKSAGILADVLSEFRDGETISDRTELRIAQSPNENSRARKKLHAFFRLRIFEFLASRRRFGSDSQRIAQLKKL